MVVGRFGMTRQQNNPAIFRAHIVAKRREAGMAADLNVVQIIKSRAPQRPVGHVEACRRDDTDGDIEAGRKPQYGPGILRYVRLVQREPQGFPLHVPKYETDGPSQDARGAGLWPMRYFVTDFVLDSLMLGTI